MSLETLISTYQSLFGSKRSAAHPFRLQPSVQCLEDAHSLEPQVEEMVDNDTHGHEMDVVCAVDESGCESDDTVILDMDAYGVEEIDFERNDTVISDVDVAHTPDESGCESDDTVILDMEYGDELGLNGNTMSCNGSGDGTHDECAVVSGRSAERHSTCVSDAYEIVDLCPRTGWVPSVSCNLIAEGTRGWFGLVARKVRVDDADCVVFVNENEDMDCLKTYFADVISLTKYENHIIRTFMRPPVQVLGAFLTKYEKTLTSMFEGLLKNANDHGINIVSYKINRFVSDRNIPSGLFQLDFHAKTLRAKRDIPEGTVIAIRGGIFIKFQNRKECDYALKLFYQAFLSFFGDETNDLNHDFFYMDERTILFSPVNLSTNAIYRELMYTGGIESGGIALDEEKFTMGQLIPIVDMCTPANCVLDNSIRKRYKTNNVGIPVVTSKNVAKGDLLFLHR